MIDHSIQPWWAKALAALVVVLTCGLLFLLVGCATITWSCPEPVKVMLRDTSTEIRCEREGKSVVITHPKGTRSTSP